MSHVLIGIIGVILFIGVALAGASFFGPRFTEATVHSEADLIMQPLAQISMALQVRNRELETAAPAGMDLADLAPDYLPEAPENALGGPDPILVDADGNLDGPGTFVIMKIPGQRAPQLCNSISKQGLGPEVAPELTSADVERTLGCFRITRNVTAQIREGDYIAYSTVY